MKRRVLFVLTAVLVTGCGRAAPAPTATPPPAASSPAPASPEPGSGSGSGSGSGIAPPPLGTRGAKLSEQQPVTVRVPERLRIAAIGVDQPVSQVGVAADGQLDVPPAADSVSWYRYGPSPGDPGSAVLAGHVDYDGVEGVFWQLDQVRAGQLIDVGYGGGGATTFRVVSREQYAKSGLPLADLFRRDGPARLVLITCGGSFDRERHSYRDNIVVTAEPL